MSIKRYNVMSYSIDADGFTGPFVKHEDHIAEVAKLQSQLTALTSQLESVVAENAAQKGALNKIAFTYSLSPHIHEMTTIAAPATDAFLAEVRASGVEMFASHLRTNDNGASVCKMIALGADEFAAQLRQEAK